MFEIIIESRAEVELKHAHFWYANISEQLGKRFMNELNAILEHIALHPTMHPKKYKNYRTLNLKVFPYQIIYEVLKKENKVLVLSVFDGRRNPKIKYKK